MAKVQDVPGELRGVVGGAGLRVGKGFRVDAVHGAERKSQEQPLVEPAGDLHDLQVGDGFEAAVKEEVNKSINATVDWGEWDITLLRNFPKGRKRNRRRKRRGGAGSGGENGNGSPQAEGATEVVQATGGGGEGQQGQGQQGQGQGQSKSKIGRAHV